MKSVGGVIRFPDGREILDLRTRRGRQLYRERIEAMWRRQKFVCKICKQPMARLAATFDHELGRGMGGAHRDDRIEIAGKPINAAVHWSCNTVKGSKRGYDRS